MMPSSWTRTDDELKVERKRLAANGSRWMQTGPGEDVDPGDRYPDGWANGTLWVGYTVLAGDAYSMHLVATPFDGYVYTIDADPDGYDSARLEFMRYPAELL